ncbi:class II aldolase/adducin family protein [Variovorax sp. PAMC 28711]|uniref:class II aldolase/adducin family protein n=1 Tax=Variovorax sp. PAMC 28711 TaxID=1795631 RepID=UPI00078D2CDC|nr:aldolase [Variovorax sp. PAMC 28711]AMM26556.1 class II aldolase [Variovorax sp. PAMC 28711]
MNESTAREEICRVGRSLFDRGYVHATAGNISVHLPASEGGGFLITPTDACLGFLEPARLAHLDAEGVQLGGDRASKTLALHRRIYAASVTTAAPAGCVIHTHSTHCVALTLGPDVCTTAQGPELLPALTPYFVMKVGHVPLIGYARPGAPEAAAEAEAAIARYHAAGTPIRAVMLARLGPNVWHETPAAAMAVLEELEETAKLWALRAPDAPLLDAAQIDQLRQQFGAHW